MNEIEFGKQLRETTQKVAVEAAMEVVNKLGASVDAWARMAAADAVRTAAADAVRPTLEGMAKIRVDLERIEDTLTRNGALMGALDTSRLGNDYAEMQAAQVRLEKARGDLIAEIAKARESMAEAAKEVATVMEAAAARSAAVEAVAGAIAAKHDAVLADVAKTAALAAETALEAMVADRLAELDDFVAGMRVSVAAEIVAARKRVGVMVRDAEDRLTHFRAPLVFERHRQPRS